MELSLFALVLQIGFNAALNIRGYNSNLMNSSPRFLNSRHTRRLPEADTYVPLSSRGIPGSLEHSDSEYSSSIEDYSYRRVRPLQSRPNQRRNGYRRYDTKPENYVGLEEAPVGRINSNNNAESLQPSSSSRRWTNTNYRRPNSRPSNLRQGQTRKYYRKAIGDSSLEVSSLESSYPEDSSRLGEEANYLRSLLSLIERPNNRIINPGNNNLYTRRNGDGLNINDNNWNSLLSYRRLKPRPELITDSIVTRKLNRNSNDNPGLESALKVNTEKLTVLHLASLEDLDLKPSVLRNGNNRTNNHRNFLRLSLSPNNKIALDEGVASDLSELVSETLDELNLAPVNLRRYGLSYTKNSRRKNNRLSAEKNNLSDLSVLPLGKNREPANRRSNLELSAHENHTSEVPEKVFDEDTAKTLVPYHEGKTIELTNNRRDNKENNTRTDDGFSDEFSLDTLFAFRKETNLSSNDMMISKDNDTLHLEFPWDDQLSPGNKKSSKISSEPRLRSRSKSKSPEQNENAKDSTDVLHLEFPWNGPLSSDGDEGKTKLKTDEKKDQTKDTTDILHLEFPWNDALRPEDDKGKPQLRNKEQKETKKDTTDTLHLEFPWNGELSSEGDEGNSKLRTDEKKDNSKDTDTLELEYPWNDVLSPDSDKSKQLRSKDKTKDTTDTLHLEFPWNDQLSPDNTKTGIPISKSLLRSQSEDRQVKETKDELKLEFPWTEKTSPEQPSSKKTAVPIPDPFFIHPYLRSRNISKHPNYYRRSHDEDSEVQRLEHLKPSPSESLIRLGEIGLAREGSRESNEDPNDKIIFPSDRRHSRV